MERRNLFQWRYYHSAAGTFDNRRGLQARAPDALYSPRRTDIVNSVLKFVQVFALGTWIGSIMYLSFIVAPGAFATLKDREQAGAMVGYSLSRLHLVGMIVGLLYLVTAFVLVRAVKDLVNPAILGVVLMILLTAFSQTKVTSRMHDLRVQMVSVDATPKDNPLRVEFDHLHDWSVRLEVAVLLIGIASLFFTVRNPTT
jgi:uncharacterized membrane protein